MRSVLGSCRSLPRVALAAALLAAAGCGSAGLPPATASAPANPGAAVSLPDAVSVRVAGRVVSVAFEDYVAATALSEVTPINETPATVAAIYDVQTIVARSYALAHLGRHRADGFDLCDGTHCQLYEPARLASSRFAAEARSAAARTAGQILVYGGRTIDALFHADCGGHTASPAQVWGTAPRAYLPSGPDTAPGATHRQWSVTVSRDALRAALNADTRMAVGRTLSGVSVDGRDASGRATTLRLSGATPRTVRSDDFRAAVNKALGPRGVMSTRFTVSRRGQAYVISGTGFGHGVGLCQTGAAARARKGELPAAILRDYYPGARLVTAAPRPTT